MHVSVQMPTESTRETESTGGCELPNMGTKN